MTITISHADYRDRVRGMWIGKFVGGSAGAPLEGIKAVHALSDSDVVPSTLVENDDTDLQLLWMHALDVHGPGLTAKDLAREWREHVDAPWCEYGVAAWNLARGIEPPASGRTANWFFGENMGCPIRSEIWGAICPGAPAAAARYAGMDASIDHIGIAVDAERFLAAIEAALFVDQDVRRLIAIGLEHCDAEGRFARMVQDVVRWQAILPWTVVRERILQRHGDTCSLHALPNLGFTVLALLEAGRDPAAAIATAINCGWDTDCTAATAGAIIGGILGASRIPAALRDAVPETFRISPWMRGFPHEGSLDWMVDATCAHGVRASRELGTGVEIAGAPDGRPAPLAVAPQPDRIAAPVPATWPHWRIAGPFTMPWRSRQAAEGDHGDAPVSAGMPSLVYITHQLPVPLPDLPPGDGLFTHPPTGFGGHPVREVPGVDDRLPLEGLLTGAIPGSVLAGARFRCDADHDAWLQAGSTGPLRVVLDGTEQIASDTYQPLNPTTFAVRVRLARGEHRLVLALIGTSQPLGACVCFKADPGRHWHQCFLDLDLHWLPADRPHPGETPGP